ncbi:putative nuclease HARBI1 [Rhinatrema bivittatum]|uniref:putative nuclease HARBI1 n=1 Tax=Rhinatrema bivittatum TaxID=194408 RepID=UPI00112B2742|nr:putative nuclease HARBI1 [Rhinatrema bivittatum]
MFTAAAIYVLQSLRLRRERERRRRQLGRRRYPLHRVYRTRTQFLDLSEEEVMTSYRFDKETILSLCQMLEGDLQPRTQRGHALPVHIKVTTFLAFLATGSFQTPLGLTSEITQGATSRCLEQALAALLRHTHHFISFPIRREEQHETMRDFYQIARFPSVLGAIDCTHVPLRAPGGDEAIYRNRKGFHSLNMQVVCNAKGLITNVVPRFPGSTHDAYILTQSRIYEEFQLRHITGGWLLGDRSYPLKSWLMIPMANPNTAAEMRYNRAHRRTRAVIERTFGILKSRFRCLDRSGGCLLYSPSKVCEIFLACCILHNLAINRHIPVPEDRPEENEEEDIQLSMEELEEIHHLSQRQAIRERNSLIESHFRR